MRDALGWLRFLGRLIVFYGLIGLVGAVLFLVGATVYAFPWQSVLYVSGVVSACAVIGGLRAFYRSGAKGRLSDYDRFLSLPGHRH